MQNFAAIRSAVLEKMTFEVAIFGNFPDIPELKLSLPPEPPYASGVSKIAGLLSMEHFANFIHHRFIMAHFVQEAFILFI